MRTSRQKICDALEHRQGEVPVDLGALPTTGIHVSVLEKLRDYYGLQKQTIIAFEPSQMLGLVDDDLREIIGCDTTPLWNRTTLFGFENTGFKEYVTPWGQTVLVAEKFTVTRDDRNTYIYAKGDTSWPPSAVMPDTSYFFDAIVRQNHFDENNLDPADNLQEFMPVTNEDLSYYAREAARLAQSPYFVCGNLGGTALGDIGLVPAAGLEDPRGIRDFAEWYMSTVLRPDYLHAVFEQQVDIALKNLSKVFGVLGDAVGVVYVCGNDLGTQTAPFCSPDTFRSLYAAYYRKINDWIHTHTSCKTFKHSCGAIESLLPELIEAGFDIINPVQWTATGMDIDMLKKKYGRDLVFWGGGIDTQHTLPFGTPEQVREQTLHTCEILSKDGGFVFATIHNILAGTPVANVAAMFEAVKEFNGKR